MRTEHGFGHRGGLKFYPRCKLYKASNVVLDPEALTAHSYDWWRFLDRIDGKLIFNEFPYSVSTRRHQHKTRNTLRELGIEIDLVVSTRLSLKSPTWKEAALTQARETLLNAREKAKRARRDVSKVLWLELAIEQQRRIDALERLIK